MRIIRTSIAVIAFAATTHAVADPVDSFCRSVESSVNGLADFTLTKCLPTASKKNRQNSFILLSEKPVLSNADSKKAWMVVACAAVGSELNKASSVRADEIWFSDIAHTKSRVAFAAPAATCRSLQSRVRGGSLSVEQMYAALTAELVRKEVE